MPDQADRSASVVVVAGEVDVETSPKLAGTIRQVLRTAPARVVVDMGGVEFIDASGIGVLLAAADAARHNGAAVVVRRPSKSVRRVMDLLQLDGALPVEDEPAGTS